MSITDASQLPDGELLLADVCIVGAGPAGITLALALEGSGMDVILLEGGGETPRPEIQALNAGESEGEPYFPLETARLRYLGGSTNHWEGYIRALDPPDLTSPVLEAMGAWPFEFGDLEDHYRAACRLCEVDDSLDFSEETWLSRAGSQVLPTDQDILQTEVLLRGPPTRFGPRYRDELDASEDIRLHLNANVVELVAGAARIDSLRIEHLGGGSQSVRAQVYVLATGGIEVPRLFLSSVGADGVAIGNQNDLVGRFFMEHPHFGGMQLVCADAQGLPLYTEEFEVEGQRINPILTIPHELRRARGIGNVAAFLMQPGPFAREFLGDDPLAGSVRALMRDGLNREAPDHLRVQLMVEQVPNARSRVRLSSTRDALGVPRCILNWELHQVDHHTLHTAAELVAGQLARAEVGRVTSATHGGPTPYSFTGGYHHMGTTRMHEDPALGVVDVDGRVHGVENLFVSSSATFPTVGFANPTLTIVAMALRLGQHLAEEGVR